MSWWRIFTYTDTTYTGLATSSTSSQKLSNTSTIIVEKSVNSMC